MERNFELINKSTFCICYYDVQYSVPDKKKNIRPSDIALKSGTAIAYNYAVKKSKRIINVIDCKPQNIDE